MSGCFGLAEERRTLVRLECVVDLPVESFIRRNSARRWTAEWQARCRWKVSSRDRLYSDQSQQYSCAAVAAIQSNSLKYREARLDCQCIAWASPHRGKWGHVTPWKNGWKIKKQKHAKKSSFLYLCCILRAIRAGRCRERRYGDHIFIQIYSRMHHFVVKFSKFSSPHAARGHWSP